MNDIEFFTKNFIIKQAQTRFLSSFSGKWRKAQKELHKVDRYLNKNCTLIQNNGMAFFHAELPKLLGHDITYIDYYDGIKNNITIKNLEIKFDDSVLICIETQSAYVFFHEEWLYICKIS